VVTPPEFPQGEAGLWSPEHLLIGAVASCFMTTFLAIAEKARLNFKSFHCKAVGNLDTQDGLLMITEITIIPQVELVNPLDAEKAEMLLEKAEKHCLITHSIKSKVNLETSVISPI
jgi:hypothetical protein